MWDLNPLAVKKWRTPLLARDRVLFPWRHSMETLLLIALAGAIAILAFWLRLLLKLAPVAGAEDGEDAWVEAQP
ncbi:MAG TPA: hypothetical protein VEO54_17300 [Thermoanaerobaculia bacterium]|nr:hypothetical protein [Thermoanaerobaculia bacterium]